MKKYRYLPLLLLAPLPALAQEPADTIYNELEEIVITQERGTRKSRGATNTEVITSTELLRAACCNLGESFTTNPSVDVNYTDAATGARQIRLLGLSGSYVQMLSENIPAMRGAASPFSLGYVPGPWMQSIQVSKGASSVKNGFESVTGQINLELKKPQADPSLLLNMYYDMMNKLELNAVGNMQLGRGWSGALLTHFENGFSSHDGNDDGFSDSPRVRQISLMPRVAYFSPTYIFQAGAKFLDERRLSGQDEHHAPVGEVAMPLYKIHIDTRRWEAFAKNAFIFDPENGGNIALILSGSIHDMTGSYGLRISDILQQEAYASLLFERSWGELHSLSAGASLSYDRYVYDYRFTPEASLPLTRLKEHEATPGIYAQYTFNLDDRIVAMAGLRYDHSSLYGSMLTPRLHLRYNPSSSLTFHASAGRGFRSPHPLAEYSYMLASSRRLDIAPDLRKEDAWNFGAGGSWSLYPAGKKLTLSAEYYYTRFSNQLMLNLDRDPHAALIYSSSLPSFSHALQLEVNYSPLRDLKLTAAWRFTDVQAHYTSAGLSMKPLTSRHKGLLTAGWYPQMGLWALDASLAINGGGRMPTPYTTSDGLPSWNATYKAFLTLSAQVTRNFRHWSIYVGGENLTGYRQPNPIIGAADPWGSNFDATMIYGPLQGAMVYVGFRYNITKYL